jgi:RNA polymerase sigma-70 factor (sigma-E family)
VTDNLDTRRGAAASGGASAVRTVDDSPDRLADTVVDISALYAAHRLPMIRLAVLLLDDVGSAEDVVQDAFIGLTRAAPRLRTVSAAYAYLRTSVVNGSRSTLRRRRTVRGFLSRVSAPEPAPAADRGITVAESRDEVTAALGTLPSRMREVLVLRYWSELSERDIAHTLGVSEGTVKSTASRALDRLEIALGGTR